MLDEKCISELKTKLRMDLENAYAQKGLIDIEIQVKAFKKSIPKLEQKIQEKEVLYNQRKEEFLSQNCPVYIKRRLSDSGYNGSDGISNDGNRLAPSKSLNRVAKSRSKDAIKAPH